MKAEELNQEYVLGILEKLLAVPSPSGFFGPIMKLVEEEAAKLGLACERLPKGSALIKLPGRSDEALGMSAHVDTLGAMVRSVKENGRLRFTPVGGYSMHSVEGEYCTIHTRDGRTYSGTIQSTRPSVHVFPDARDLKREEANMEIRLDESAANRADVAALGIRTGDYVSFDPRTVFLPNGWIKSRHLDDKAGVACLFGLLESYVRREVVPPRTLYVFLSVYEEVGHGSSYMPPELRELLAIDMGAIGDDLSCTERDVSICAKDSSGPYDYEMTSKLIRLAERDGLGFAVDIYPYYSSDATAAVRAGSNLRAALLGPGVQASHGMERTHRDALWNTIRLLDAYATEEARD
ncbi:aminopeptidase [Paenibacillus sp. J31TS4]|uniref:M42 family metallopeptidase n=1 Tax=Paenibacillus sp. J31TS4 TaxID=2807195 RepID=UPI001B1A1F25|nr:M42 family metallopeptidase [Paenibacillus sp. J31TS4]GIP37291.1 aminopeptidase [Paenibacillus sp. J31TS4]